MTIWYGGTVQASQICPNITYGYYNTSQPAVYSNCKINGSRTFGLRMDAGSVKEFMDPISNVTPSVTLTLDTGSYKTVNVTDKGTGYAGDCTEVPHGSGSWSATAVSNHVYCYVLEGSLGVTATRATWTGSSFSNALFTFGGTVPTNSAPIITQGSSISFDTPEDAPKSFTLNATDAEDNIQMWSIYTNPDYGSLSGVSGGGTSKVITYTPTANWNGTDSF
ncbi:Ig-like domain-containing protein, partial [Thiotrichales bacterium HSG1]|nr:Ig-like domain-containing protein [Thiotrichales bacterium HSG1]